MPNLEPITWTEKEVAVKDLKPYERNPRQISEKAFDRLKNDIKKFGFHQRILCQPDLKVIGGHQRIRALEALGIKTVKCLIPSRELTLEEFRELLIKDNVAYGEWDWDIISADFPRDKLVAWGVPPVWNDESKARPIGGEENTGGGNEGADTFGSQFSVLVICENENDQKLALEKLLALGYNVKALTA